MAGALDSLFKNVAKAVVKDLGTSLDATITYVRKTAPSYDVATGTLTTHRHHLLKLKSTN